MSTIALRMFVLACVLVIFTIPVVPAARTANTTTVCCDYSQPTGNINNIKDLHVIGLFPYSGLWCGGESMQTAIQLGMDQVNSMNAIPGYRLRMTAYDTKCDPGLAIKALFEQLYTPPTKLMIVGGGCSVVSEVTARASHLWNLVQVSYVSASPTLSDKSQFPMFARLSQPDHFNNAAHVKLIRHFRWNRVATIYQSYDLFAKATEDLVESLDRKGITIIRSESFSDDPSHHIRRLKDYDCRIIFGSFYEDKAKTVMCQAFKAGLYGPKVVWILVGWYEPNWWKMDNTSTECTQEEIDAAVEGYFDAGSVYLHPDQVPSVSGWSPSDFMREYSRAVNNRSLPMEGMSPLGYDTIWAIALALNNTRNLLKDMGSSRALEDFSYNDSEIGNLLYSSLLNLTFMGVKGPIRFDRNGDPVGLIKISRVQNGVRQTVAYYNPFRENGSRLHWSTDNVVVWKGGNPPRDSVQQRTVLETLSVPLYVSMCVMAVLGILLAGGFLAFNILLRHVRLVKMFSPRLNNVILLGCICAYCTIFVQSDGAGHGTLGCEANTALLVLGMSTTFGTLFAKTWRVHVIFSSASKKPLRRIWTAAKLLGMVLLLQLVNMSVLVTWWLVDRRVLRVKDIKSAKEEDDTGEVEVTYKEQHCESDHQVIFLGILYAIHVLLLLWGTLLAFETRNVHYPELNDSKYIGMCIYNVTLLIIPSLVLDVALKSGVNVMYGLNAALILFGTTVTQCLIFVPKVVSYRAKTSSDEAEQTSNQEIDEAPPNSTGAPSHPKSAAVLATLPCVSPVNPSSQQLGEANL